MLHHNNVNNRSFKQKFFNIDTLMLPLSVRYICRPDVDRMLKYTKARIQKG